MANTTIYDVAGAAKVSLATVSRVMNNPEKVNPETRERVLKVIKELGYKPNAIARGLASRKSTTIGVIISDITRASISQMLGGIIDIAKKYEYSVKLFSASNVELEDTMRNVVAEQVDGILFLNEELNKEEIDVVADKAKDANIPTVLTNVNFTLTVASNSDYETAIGTNNALRVCGLDPDNISEMTYTLEKPGSGWATESTANITYHQDGASSDQEDYLRCSYQVTEVNSGSKSITINFKFGFGRGSVFEYVNPCDAKCADDSDGSKLTYAVNALNALQNLKSVTNLFTLTVTPNYTAA